MAALNPKDGSLAWRRVLGEGDAVSHLEVDAGGAGASGASRVLTLSGGGRSLRAFDGESGRMLWQAALQGHAGCGQAGGACDLTLNRAGEARQVLVALGPSVAVRGQAQWAQRSPAHALHAASPLLRSCFVDYAQERTWKTGSARRRCDCGEPLCS